MLNGLKRSLNVRGLTVGGALTLAVAGCGGPEAVEVGAEQLAVRESALIPKGTGPLPTTSQLQPLNVNTADRGRLLLASNNPETVTSYGILFSTQADPPSTVFRGDTAAYPYTASAPSAALPTGSSKVLDSTCAPGAVREIGVYIAHILGSNISSGHIALYVTPNTSTTLEVTGDLANGPFTTRDPNFVSNRVAQDYFFNFSAVRRTVSVTANTYTLIDVAGGTGGYFDGRLNLRATAGCFHVHVVAQSSSTPATALPSTWARGNIKWPGWSGSGSFGTTAGVYAGDKISGTQSFALPGPGFLRGYVIGAVAQAYSAVYRYGDSASINFGNYGNFYDQTFTVTNSSTTTCMRARAEYVSYANVPTDSQPIYSIYNALPDPLPTMYWNGPLRFLTTAGTWSAVEDVILYPERNSTTPNAIPPSIRHGIQELIINPGSSGTFRFQFAVPGLIRVPAAVVFTSVGC